MQHRIRVAYRIIVHDKAFLQRLEKQTERDFAGASRVYPEELPVNRTFHESFAMLATFQGI